MVAQVSKSMQQYLQARPGLGYDGVVKVAWSGGWASGVLLYDGRHVLSSRHALQGILDATTAQITFETSAGMSSISAKAIKGSANWNLANLQDDYVLIELSKAAPLTADRYQLYRYNNDLVSDFVLVGYGYAGTGASGADLTVPATRSLAFNRFEGDLAGLKSLSGSTMGWTPPSGTQLYADFDDGTALRDAVGAWKGKADLGLGNYEGMITSGDSGSPAFINGQIAGLASATFSLAPNGIRSDVDGISNGSFGEIGVWQRVSAYQQTIDTLIRTTWADAPKSRAEVKTTVGEGNGGTKLAYFLLEFGGVRQSSQDILSVDYVTRDGTAKAGEDYLATKGTLVLYPDENQAVIAVEVIGDSLKEGNETFYLDVTNPVGGSFGEGVSHLTAMRTILDDDAGVQLLGLSPVASLV